MDLLARLGVCLHEGDDRVVRALAAEALARALPPGAILDRALLPAMVAGTRRWDLGVGD